MKTKSKTGYDEFKDLSKYQELMLIAALSKYFEKVGALEEKMDIIEHKIDMLLQAQEHTANEGVIIVKEVPYEQAKEEVINYFKANKEATIVDLHQDLGIPIETLIEIIDELSKEGLIGE